MSWYHRLFRLQPKDRVDGYSPPKYDGKDPWQSPEVKAELELRAMIDGQERLDSFRNALTGIGDYLRDKRFGGEAGGLPFDLYPVSNNDAEARWRGSDLGHRIVEAIPSEMTREGWELSIQPEEEDAEEDDSAAAVEALEGKLEEWNAVDVFFRALCYEQAFGGGAILLGADDGETDLSKPLREDRITSIRHLTAFSGGWDGEIIAWSYYTDPTKPNYGKPETYVIRNIGVPIASTPVPGTGYVPTQTSVNQSLFWVHESRLLVFDGAPATNRVRVQMRGWGDSVFTRVDRVLQDYDQTWGAIGNLMTDFAQAILKMDGLAELMGRDQTAGTTTLTERARSMAMTRSVARMLIIDKDEDFDRKVTSLAGIPDMLGQLWLRTAAAADMPLSLLVGQVKGGLGDAGNTDLRFFYDRIAARQRLRMLPQLKRLMRLMFIAKDSPTGGVEPERWNLKMNSLWQMTEKEQAEVRKIVADTDAIYLQQGVLTAEEVTASRFGGSEWTMETVLDLEGREKLNEMEEAKPPPALPPQQQQFQPSLPPTPPASESPAVDPNASAQAE